MALKLLGMISFEEKDLNGLAEEIGFEIKNGYLYENKKKVKCYVCEEDISTENLGGIYPYKGKTVLCKEVFCLIEFMEESGMEFEEKTTSEEETKRIIYPHDVRIYQ